MTGAESQEEIKAAIEREGASTVVDAFLVLFWPERGVVDVTAEARSLTERLDKIQRAGGFWQDSRLGAPFALSCLNAAFSSYCLERLRSSVISDKKARKLSQTASFEYLKLQGELEALKTLCAEILEAYGQSSEFHPSSSFIASQLLLQQLGTLLHAYALTGAFPRNEVVDLLALLTAVIEANAEYGSGTLSDAAVEQIMAALGVSSPS